MPERGVRACRAAALVVALYGSILGAALTAPSATAQGTAAVDVALVLAVDVSPSMDPGEQALQRQGYVEALRHPAVLAAIGSGFLQRVALAYFEWGAPVGQNLVLPWTVIDDAASAGAAAATLASAPIVRSRGTSISGALDFAGRLFVQLAQQTEASRRVVDVSGDGPNNFGRPVRDARDALLALGITVNGLPIMLRDMGYTAWTIPDLDLYYAACVVGGPGSFVLPVRDIDDMATAIRQKLILEIADQPARAQPVDLGLAQEQPGVDCLIGERLRRQMWSD